MADLVDVKTLFDGKRYKIFHLTNQSDGTGEAAVAKVTIANFTNARGDLAVYSTIDRIEYQVSGFNWVKLEWDHTVDDEIAVMKGNGFLDWSQSGGNTDPRTAGGNGNIILTTNPSPAAPAGSSYDITLYVRMKAA